MPEPVAPVHQRGGFLSNGCSLGTFSRLLFVTFFGDLAASAEYAW